MPSSRKVDLAYVAGLFDGEGCINLRPRSNTKKQTYELQVTLVSTNEWITQQLKFSFGGNVYYTPENFERNWKASWRWLTQAQNALRFLELVYPYLKLKKPQAEIAIKFQKHKRRNAGGRFDESYFSLDEELYQAMKRLNKRGVR